MNKRYIDFVPAKSNKTAGRQQRGSAVHVEMPGTRSVKRLAAKPVAKKAAPRSAVRVTASRTVSGAGSSTVIGTGAGSTARVGAAGEVPMLGVIEDLNAKFVNTDVPKRPLHHSLGVTAGVADLNVAKAKKITGKGANKATSVVSAQKAKLTGDKGTFKTPKTPFINQEKVVKRPLSRSSKNVYQKKAVVSKEVKSAPVAIISKPEKESHVGIVVTVIVTIILGAAAGTVAFLLLPK